ncbi:MAG: DUF485 domain-containing protein [Campylobacterota bacterium]|nr:DUF485 domain-containing protein [Campylobacterota bacterium]
MQKELIEQIKSNPDYQRLVKERTRFAIKLTVTMLVVYFTFILTIAFIPSLLGIPLFDSSVTTIGFPIGIAIIIFAFILTGIYTKRANSEFDSLTAKIKDSIKEK